MTDPCIGCVFYSEKSYGVHDYGINTHCYHPVYYMKNSQCPTVASYRIKKNLGLIKVDEE